MISLQGQQVCSTYNELFRLSGVNFPSLVHAGDKELNTIVTAATVCHTERVRLVSPTIGLTLGSYLTALDVANKNLNATNSFAVMTENATLSGTSFTTVTTLGIGGCNNTVYSVQGNAASINGSNNFNLRGLTVGGYGNVLSGSCASYIGIYGGGNTTVHSVTQCANCLDVYNTYDGYIFSNSTSTQSLMLGGSGNKMFTVGQCNTIYNGLSNKIEGYAAEMHIVTGQGNYAKCQFQSIFSGISNLAEQHCAFNSVIGTGYRNWMIYPRGIDASNTGESFIFTGTSNLVTARRMATIFTGNNNMILSAQCSFIGTGCFNQISQTRECILGHSILNGSYNVLSGDGTSFGARHSIINGCRNYQYVLTDENTIVNGTGNCAVAAQVATGTNNYAFGCYNWTAVLGGCCNRVDFGCHIIYGGAYNSMSAKDVNFVTTIFNGLSNTYMNGCHGNILNGESNKILGMNLDCGSQILGGRNNTLFSCASVANTFGNVILGGENNTFARYGTTFFGGIIGGRNNMRRSVGYTMGSNLTAGSTSFVHSHFNNMVILNMPTSVTGLVSGELYVSPPDDRVRFVP